MAVPVSECHAGPWSPRISGRVHDESVINDEIMRRPLQRVPSLYNVTDLHRTSSQSSVQRMGRSTGGRMDAVAWNTSFSHTFFYLRGFPGCSQFRQVLAIPILFLDLLILMGNGTMAYVVWTGRNLRSPMYILISMIFFCNISYGLAFMPKFLLGLTFDVEQITLTGCLTQMFFMYVAGSFNSNLLFLMAVDRYVAVLQPLSYHLIITKNTFALLIFLGSLRSLLLSSLIVGSTSNIRFCGSNVIVNFACENMSLLNLGCGNVAGVQAVGLWVRILLTVTDGSFVAVSYVRIICAVMKLVSGKARDKAWQTCSAHLLVATVTYSSGLSSSIVYRIGHGISSDILNTVSLLNYIIPAAADPIIYGVKMTEIRNSLKDKIFTKRQPTIHVTTGPLCVILENIQ
ncbi:olfactory receptor 52E8-like [Mantella aurantiaca]